MVWSCIVITAGPHQQLLPLPNLLYQIKYDDDDDDDFLVLVSHVRMSQAYGCACRTSGNLRLKLKLFEPLMIIKDNHCLQKLKSNQI